MKEENGIGDGATGLTIAVLVGILFALAITFLIIVYVVFVIFPQSVVSAHATEAIVSMSNCIKV